MTQQYKSLTQSCVVIAKEEGVKALWKGITPRLLRIMPGQAITFMTYEAVSARMEKLGWFDWQCYCIKTVWLSCVALAEDMDRMMIEKYTWQFQEIKIIFPYSLLVKFLQLEIYEIYSKHWTWRQFLLSRCFAVLIKPTEISQWPWLFLCCFSSSCTPHISINPCWQLQSPGLPQLKTKILLPRTLSPPILHETRSQLWPSNVRYFWRVIWPS